MEPCEKVNLPAAVDYFVGVAATFGGPAKCQQCHPIAYSHSVGSTLACELEALLGLDRPRNA